MIHLDLTVHKDNLMLTTTHELYQPYTRNGTEDKNKSENKLIKDFLCLAESKGDSVRFKNKRRSLSSSEAFLYSSLFYSLRNKLLMQ